MLILAPVVKEEVFRFQAVIEREKAEKAAADVYKRQTLESLTNESRRCKDRTVPISQAKGQSIKKRSYDFCVLVLG